MAGHEFISECCAETSPSALQYYVQKLKKNTISVSSELLYHS